MKKILTDIIVNWVGPENNKIVLEELELEQNKIKYLRIAMYNSNTRGLLFYRDYQVMDRSSEELDRIYGIVIRECLISSLLRK